MQKIVLVGIGISIVAAGIWFYTSPRGNVAQQAQPEVQAPKQQTFSVQVTSRKQTPDIVTVTQGDSVTMRVMSDEVGEYHVSGYEIENKIEVGKQLEFAFTADKAGRYNFELHPAPEEGEDIVVGAFVVNPR